MMDHSVAFIHEVSRYRDLAAWTDGHGLATR